MGRLVLVRHGQANFLGENYDQLSALGAAQARALAEHWLREGRRFDRVYSGTLHRQVGTAAIVGDAYRAAGAPWPDPTVLPGLDEFPAEELMRILVPQLLRRETSIAELHASYRRAAADGDRRTALFRLLEAVTARWIGGAYDTGTLPTWEAFRARVRATLATMFDADACGREIAAFTSGGVIGVCVHTVQRTSSAEAAASIWRLRNCSLTQLLLKDDGIEVDCLDTIPHLTRAELVTHR